MKKVFTSIMAAIMLLTMLSSAAFAATSDTVTNMNVFDILEQTSSYTTSQAANGSVVYTITDPDAIRKLSDEKDLPDMIELTYIPADEAVAISKDSEVSPQLFESYEIRNKKDHGISFFTIQFVGFMIE